LTTSNAEIGWAVAQGGMMGMGFSGFGGGQAAPSPFKGLKPSDLESECAIVFFKHKFHYWGSSAGEPPALPAKSRN